jgi:hypothetical protein
MDATGERCSLEGNIDAQDLLYTPLRHPYEFSRFLNALHA